MPDLRPIVVLALFTAACTTPAESGDDSAGCFEGKCDAFGGAEQLSALSQTITNPDSVPRGFAVLGDKVLFFSALKKGLWISDGTTAGTHLVRDLAPTLDSFQTTPVMTVLGGKAYWAFQQTVWMSDGTPAGTQPLIQLDYATAQYMTDVITFNGSLLFGTTAALYLSDGTPAGTQVLAQMGVINRFATMGGKLYFPCKLAASGQELCVTDKTAAGTRLVSDTWPGIQSADPVFIGVVNNKLLFSGTENNSLSLRGLYASDGTAAGTVRLMAAQPNGDFVSRFVEGVTFNGALYFDCYTAATGSELCKSDGTAAGTSVLDLLPGTGSGAPDGMAVIGTKLVFTASSTAAGREVWASDGTVAGSAMLADIYPGTFDGLSGTRYVRLGNQLLFGARGTDFRNKLWGTDGTASGTRMIADILGPNVSDRYPLGMAEAVVLGTKLVFAAADGSHGQEPWTTDGTTAGTKLLADVAEPTTQLDAYEATTFGTGSYFALADNMAGTIWRTDGTAAGTSVWQQVSRNTTPGFTKVGSTLYYRNDDQLWKTSGQGAGTKVKDLPGRIIETAVLGNTLAFTGTTPNLGYGLWFSDGTAAGTVVTNALNGEYLRAANGRLWLKALYGSAGNELWTSDGTVTGTVPVADINPSGDSDPSGFIALGGKTLFSAKDAAAGSELWTTDGTASGTRRVADISTGTRGSGPYGLTALNATTALFWASPTTTSGYELWRTDGTAANTARVKAVAYGDYGPFVVWGNVALFSGKDGGGSELWRTDGTEAGTARIADIYPGVLSSNPRELVLAGPNGPLYFVAEEPVGGRELWMLDSPTGTPVRAADIAPGPRSSNPSLLQARGTALLFVAEVGHGPALFRIGDAPDVIAPTIDCPDDLAVAAKDAAGAIVMFPLPSASDNKGAPTVTTMPASGDLFAVGDTTVTATASDSAANTASCTFVVHVTYDGHGGVDGDDGGDGGSDGGCSTSGGSAGTLGLVMLALAINRRRNHAWK